MKRLSNYLIYSLLLMGAVRSSGQTDGVTAVVNRIISPSPTAAALGKYEDIPVDECTGIPGIRIPLYEIKVNNHSLPISLSYYAGGIKVEDRASWVGLGWSLNAGGVITRTVRGRPDEGGYSGGDGALIPANGFIDQFNHDGFMLLKNCSENIIDLQPDEYYFNFAGYTGKFVFDKDGIPRLIPARNIQFVLDIFGRKPRFTAITPDGIIYRFTGNELTTPSDNGEYGTPIGAYVSTWYLTEITFPDSKQTITLEYADYFTNSLKNYFYNERWEIISPNGGGLITATGVTSTININGLHLSRINFPEGSVQFLPKNGARVDIPGDHILEYVRVFDKYNSLVKSFKLDYTYYNNTSSDANLKRLRLEKIQEIGLNGATTVPPYLFTYNSLQLPSINSYSQDHWGYYNGKPNSKMIPPGKIGSTIIPGADRSIDHTYTKAGILEKITYPTGGTTTFEYEGNTQYANEKQLIDAGQMVTCNSGPGTNEPYNCYSESATFTLANAVGDIRVVTDYQYQAGNTANVFLVNITTGAITPLLNQPPYYLTGIDRTATYKLRAETYHEGGTQPEYVQGTLLWKEYNNSVTIKSKPAPGLRIKKVTAADGIDATATKIISYEYDMFNDAGRSSGYLTGAEPAYEHNFNVIEYGHELEPMKKYLVRFSKSQSDLGGSDCVYYQNVKRIVGSAAQTGSVNSYYGIGSAPYCLNNFFPFAPCTNLKYKNQLLTRQVTLNSAGKTLKDDVYTYYFEPTSNYVRVMGVAAGYTQRNYNDHGGTQLDFSSNSFSKVVFLYQSEWFYLKKLVSTLYDQNGLNPYATTTDYAYNNSAHMELSATITKNSIGDEITVAKKYPLDYAYTGTLTGTAQVMQQMVNQRLINLPVEEYAYKLIKSTNTTALLSSKVNLFKISNGQIVKGSSLTLKMSSTSTGVPLSDPSSLLPPAIRNGQFTYDARYEALNSFDMYDLTNNAVQLTGRDGTHSLIRDQNSGQIWAKTLRSKYADIAYTSFEHTTTSTFTNWNYNLAGITTGASQSGLKAYILLNNPINTAQALTPAQKYRVSFWKKVDANTVTVKAGTQTLTLRNGPARGGWQYMEAIFTGANMVQISGNGTIDELRLYPSNDRMSTFVFKPGVGLSSSCDDNNQTSFWEYDEYNRLKLSKDQDKNILNKTEYNYQQVQ